MMDSRILVVGAGLSGATVARVLAEEGGRQVLVCEGRGHVAGNCHTERQGPDGVMVHCFGPHIFHTSRAEVWAFVQRFATMRPYLNRVKAITDRGVFSFPINLLTLNQYFGRVMNPTEAAQLLQQCQHACASPANFEEQALARCGQALYESFFKHYTQKQWGVEPTRLPAALALRLPLRTTYEDAYYSDHWQALPEDGYTALVQSLLNHPRIELRTECPVRPAEVQQFRQTFWTGPVDAFFGHCLGRLRYRTLDLEWLAVKGDYQGNPVLNYCQPEVPWTRVTEYRHFETWRPFPTDGLSRVSRERPRACGPDDIPFYPLGLEEDQRLLAQYQEAAARLSRVTFLGRLGTYRYLDMDACIEQSLAEGRAYLQSRGAGDGALSGAGPFPDD